MSTTVGSALPKALVPSYFNADLVFSTPERGWVEAGGALAYTGDGGEQWARVPWPGGTVTGIEADGRSVAALVDEYGRHRLFVSFLSPAGGVRGATLPLSVSADGTSADQMTMMPATGEVVVLVPQNPADDYLWAADGVGSRWSRLAGPCATWQVDAVVATGGDGLAVDCGTGAGMNKEPKLIVVSHDGGRSWHVASAWRNAQAPDPSGLPISDLFGLAAGPGGTIYMVTTMGASLSRDDGSHWVPLAATGRAGLLPGNGSAGGEFSFVGETHAWLLWQTVALLSTADGVHWSLISALPRGY
jgi:hypothetical protein